MSYCKICVKANTPKFINFIMDTTGDSDLSVWSDASLVVMWGAFSEFDEDTVREIIRRARAF